MRGLTITIHLYIYTLIVLCIGIQSSSKTMPNKEKQCSDIIYGD